MKSITNKVTNCETISWNELKTYEFNTLKDQTDRNITKSKNSIVNSGFNSPFYIWNDHRYIIDGTGRNLALLELEKEGYQMPDLPIVKIEAENKKEALKLVLQVSSQHGQITQNSLSDFTSIDFEIEELKELQEVELNLPELQTLIESLEVEDLPDEEEQEGSIPIKKETKIVKGDIFEFKINNNFYRFGCGSSTDIDFVNKILDGKKIDLVLTDPPYGVNITKVGSKINTGKYEEIAGDKDTETAKEFYQTCQSLGFKNLIFWGGNYFTDFLPPSRCWIIWDKEMPKGMQFADGEVAWTSFDKNLKIYKMRWAGSLLASGITNEEEGLPRAEETGQIERVHPTMKPVGMQVEIINDFAPLAVNLFDGFLGGGSMMIAGIRTKKNCLGIELLPFYVDTVINRIKRYCDQNNLEYTFKHLNGNLTLEEIAK